MRAASQSILIVLITFVLHGSLQAQPAVAVPNGPNAFRVQVSGRGHPMLLIPGLSSSGDTWKTTVARYQDRFTCHVLTLAGFAGVPPIPAPLLSTVRDELAAYIREHHLIKPVIVGHSLGGTLALDLAARYPEIVGPLVIVDSLPFLGGATFQVKTVEEAKANIAAMHAYMSNQTRAQYDNYIRSGAATKYMVTSAADLEIITQWGLASDPRTVSDAMAELYSTDLRHDIAKIAVPALVLGTWIGLHDQIKAYGNDIPRAAFVQTFEQQFAELPRRHFAVAETSRHFIMFDDPQWFFAELDAFLTDPEKVASDRGPKSK